MIIIVIVIIVGGKMYFQDIFIIKSYRIRGNLTRVHTSHTSIAITSTGVNIFVDINTMLVIILIKIRDIYSPIKIMENPPLLYSVLNPDTNSLSLSLKSNGVRPTSVNIMLNQIGTTGNHSSITVIFKLNITLSRSKLLDKIIMGIITKIKLISYEIV